MFYLEARADGRVIRWPLTRDRHVLGRDEDCDLTLDHPTLSRRHLELWVDGTSIELADLGSTNGVKIEGRPVRRGAVACNEWFSAGRILLAVREGVSMTSSLGASSHCGGVGRADRAGPTAADASQEGPPEGEAGCGSAVRGGGVKQLAHALAGTDHGEPLIPAVLEFAAKVSGASTAAVVCPIGAGCAVEGLWGPPLPDVLDPLLAGLSGDAPQQLCGDGRVALAMPLPGDRTAGWLVVHPWPGGGPPGGELALAAALAAREVARLEGLRAAGRRDEPPRSGEQGPAIDPPAIIAVSREGRELIRHIDRLARSELPVLLEGETGSGKELAARRLHAQSQRAAGPFVAINCGAVPGELMEAELFGVEQGAATGVSGRPGQFMLASGGTLFLDEVGDLPSILQPKLLRALEEGSVRPVGAPQPIPVDVRIVAASHRRLEDLVEQDRFRRDLFYRLAGAVVEIPPLRDRPEDILHLARAFAAEAASRYGDAAKGLDLEVARVLCRYPWPGNVRELRNVIARAVVLAEGPVLHGGLFPKHVVGSMAGTKSSPEPAPNDDYRTARQRFERVYFSELLRRSAGNVAAAARLAGLSRTFLYQKLDEHGLREAR